MSSSLVPGCAAMKYGIRYCFLPASALYSTERELVEQDWTRKTEDFKEGVKSYAEKRPGNWKNR